MEPSRHTAVVRLLKMWAMRVGEEGYAQRVTVDDVLADDVVEAVIRNDLLRDFDPVDNAERLKPGPGPGAGSRAGATVLTL